MFGTLAAKGEWHDVSVFDGKDEPLHFAIGIGVFSFIVDIIFLVLKCVDLVGGARRGSLCRPQVHSYLVRKRSVSSLSS